MRVEFELKWTKIVANIPLEGTQGVGIDIDRHDDGGGGRSASVRHCCLSASTQPCSLSAR